MIYYVLGVACNSNLHALFRRGMSCPPSARLITYFGPLHDPIVARLSTYFGPLHDPILARLITYLRPLHDSIVARHITHFGLDHVLKNFALHMSNTLAIQLLSELFRLLPFSVGLAGV